MRQFKKKLKSAIQASNYWFHNVATNHVEKDDAKSFQIETMLKCSKANKNKKGSNLLKSA